MKGIIYTRVSSDEQIKGTSLEFQEELCRKYCEQKSIEIVAVFREEGETAKDLSLNNRKKFLEALEFCRKNKNHIQAFIVLRVDRFARNTEDHFAVRKILMNYGTMLHSVTEPIGNKPAEKFIETVLAGASEYDNAIRKQRCTDGMLARINQGIYPWKPPMGYKCSHFKKRGEKKNEPDPPDEQIFPLIQRALREYAKGLHSQVELARLLDEWGLSAVRGRKTTRQTADFILGKYLKFYTGIIINPWTGEEKEGLHKPMITKEEMYQIQLVRSGKRKHLMKRQRYNPDFPLRRTIICASCGRPLTGSSPRGHGGRYFYYHCLNKECPVYGKSMAKDTLEAKFSSYLEGITPKERFFFYFKEVVLEFWKKKEKAMKSKGLKYEKRLVVLQEKRKRIFDMREEGSYTKDEFVERKQEVENEILETKFFLSQSRIEGFDIEGVLTYAIAFIRGFGKKWPQLLWRLRPRFHKLVFPEGIPYIKDFGYGTAKLGYIYTLNQHFDGQKSSLVHFLGLNWNQIVEELKEWQGLRTILSGGSTEESRPS
ncbi:MAG: recombinase family protein [Candidatus Omnitrophota bacterium]